jgi:hypothetical protein
MNEGHVIDPPTRGSELARWIAWRERSMGGYRFSPQYDPQTAREPYWAPTPLVAVEVPPWLSAGVVLVPSQGEDAGSRCEVVDVSRWGCIVINEQGRRFGVDTAILVAYWKPHPRNGEGALAADSAACGGAPMGARRAT